MSMVGYSSVVRPGTPCNSCSSIGPYSLSTHDARGMHWNDWWATRWPMKHWPPATAACACSQAADSMCEWLGVWSGSSCITASVSQSSLSVFIVHRRYIADLPRIVSLLLPPAMPSDRNQMGRSGIRTVRVPPFWDLETFRTHAVHISGNAIIIACKYTRLLVFWTRDVHGSIFCDRPHLTRHISDPTKVHPP